VFGPSDFRDLISGRRLGWRAVLCRGLLRLVEVPYTWAVRWRNHRYDCGHKSIHHVRVPVVSVGNLTLGGTGKTPLVQWIAKRLRDRQIRLTLISRGYGTTDHGPNDEARELAEKLPDVPHLQNADRVAAAHAAIEQHDCQLILLDDGFQHRRLARDLNIVLVDALEPFGFGHVFPRGTLREPLAGLARADAVVLSRADQISTEDRLSIRRELGRHAEQAVWCETRHAPQNLLAHGGQTAPLDSLAGHRVAAFCGIGNPAGFRATLEQCGYHVVALRELPDHHHYSPEEIERLARWAREHDAHAVVCTHKDLVKVATDSLAGLPLWAISIEIEFLTGQQDLQSLLDITTDKCRPQAAAPDR
jgi:tetraacyldisaccharide 4'-kinase